MHQNISSLVRLRTVVYTKIKAATCFIAVAALPSQMLGQQCTADLLQGRDLVRNGNFSQGYTDWTYTADSDGLPNANPKGYIIFNPPTTQNYSVPGFIYAGSDPRVFNSGGFTTNFGDHTPANTDNMMLMVDGVCEPGIKLWSQSNMPMSPNTTYYFSVWIHALKNGNNPSGSLQFEIQIGTDVYNLSANPITAPEDLADGWVQFEAQWTSPITLPSTTGTISIENTTVTGCDQYVDFAIDDISFIPGCKYADASTSVTPNLGLDQTICGKGGAALTFDVTDDGIADVAANQVWWSDNIGDGTGGAGSGQFTRTITPNPASLPFTLAICTKVGSGCIKTDIVTISGDYTIDLDDATLCSPPSTTLDAGFSGTGVNYQWYTESNGVAGWQQGDTINDSKSKTLFVNTKGTYRVVVNDPACGTREAVAVIQSTAPTPQNQYFCNPGNVTLSVSPVNSGKYKWWDHPTANGISNLKKKGGNTFTFAASGTSDYTFYVQDTSSFRAAIGPDLSTNTLASPGERGVQGETKFIFDAITPFTIDSIYVMIKTYNCPFSVGISVYNSGGTQVGTTKTYTTVASDNCVTGSSLASPFVLKMPVGITVPVGTDYRVELASITGGNMVWYNSGMVYGTIYAGAVKYVSAYGGQPATSIPGMFRWSISAGTPCDRVPVQALYNCTLANSLLNFSVSSDANDANITWTALEDDDSDYYEILKSTDGLNFQSIAHINVKSQASLNNYSYTDHGIEAGITYYKLAQYDKFGSVLYSHIATASYENEGLEVYPNPTKDRFSISFKNVSSPSIRLDLRNALGTSVYSQSISTEEIDHTFEIDISHFPKGIYVLSVQGVEHNVIKIQKE